jgi:hypothetical protein
VICVLKAHASEEVTSFLSLSNTQHWCLFHLTGDVASVSFKVSENCTLQGYYTTSSGNFLLMFRNKLSVPSLGFKNLEPWGWDRCVMTQKSAVLSYFEVEAWNNSGTLVQSVLARRVCCDEQCSKCFTSMLQRPENSWGVKNSYVRINSKNLHFVY